MKSNKLFETAIEQFHQFPYSLYALMYALLLTTSPKFYFATLLLILIIIITSSTLFKMKFKAEHTFEQRQAESQRVRAKYPDRIPGTIFHIFVLK